MEHDREEAVRRLALIEHESRARCGAVGDPKIEVAIEVPVHGGDSASVLCKIESTHGRDVGKFARARVEVGAVTFIAAKGAILVQEAVERLPALAVALGGRR